MIRVLCGIVVLCAFAAPAHAERGAKSLKAQKLTQAGDARGLLKLLEDPANAVLLEDTDSLFYLCVDIYAQTRILTARGGDTIDEIFEVVLPRARALREQDARGQRGLRSWASIFHAQQWSLHLRGRSVDPDEWLVAVQIGIRLCQVGAENSSAVVATARTIGQYASVKGVDAKPLLEMGDQLLAEAVAKHPEDTGFLAHVGAFWLHKTRAALVHEGKRAAKRIATEGLAAIEEYIETGDEYGHLAQAHTDLLTFAIDHKLGVCAKYRVKPCISLREFVTLKVPTGSLWTVDPNVKEPTILSVNQYTAEGHIFRTISVRALEHGQLYDPLQTGVGVDARSAKGLAECLCERLAWELDPLVKRSKVRKGRPRRGWPLGYHFQGIGSIQSNQWIRKTITLIPCRKIGHTLELSVSEYEDAPEYGADFEYVLTSLKLPK